MQPDFYLPSFNLGAELANLSCSVPGFDFVRWYKLLDCPKIGLEVAVRSKPTQLLFTVNVNGFVCVSGRGTLWFPGWLWIWKSVKCCVVLNLFSDELLCINIKHLYFKGCKALNFCRIGDESIRVLYRDTVAGFSAAFMTAYVQVTQQQQQQRPKPPPAEFQSAVTNFPGKHGATGISDRHWLDSVGFSSTRVRHKLLTLLLIINALIKHDIHVIMHSLAICFIITFFLQFSNT